MSNQQYATAMAAHQAGIDRVAKRFAAEDRQATARDVARVDRERYGGRPSELEVARLRSQLTEGRDVAAAERAEGAKVRAEDRAASRAEEAAFLKGIELYPEMQESYYKLRGASSPERAMQIIREAQAGAVKGEKPEAMAARIIQIATREGVML